SMRERTVFLWAVVSPVPAQLEQKQSSPFMASKNYRNNLRLMKLLKFVVGTMLLAVSLSAQSTPGKNSGPIHFAYQPIDFRLENSETPLAHAPETMAGGVAVFDYNNDSKLDIFFTNGANIDTLQKDSPKYSNRLFENDGHGHFTDVTQKAGLAGTGFDMGVAIG